MNKIALARLGLLFATTAALLLAAEFWARTSDSPTLDLGKIEPWQNQAFTPPLNANRFRERPPSADVLGEDVTRVLFLGDSFTFGQGVIDGANRFSDLVETRLNREGDGRRFHIYNAGIPGSLPDKWYQALETLLPTYRPHFVLAVFFLRDGTPIGTSLRFHKNLIDDLHARYDLGFLSRHSKLVAAIGDRLAAYEFQTWYLHQFEVAYLGTPGERRVWTAMQKWLARIQNKCKAQGIPYHISIFPLLFDLDDYAYGPVEEEITRFGEQHAIPIMSLTPGFLGMDARDLWVSPSDQHPNERAHEIAAEALYPYLREALKALTKS